MTRGTTRATSADDDRGGSRQRVDEFENKINKIKDGDGLWKTVKQGTKGSLPDSYLHRYAREVGFAKGAADNRDIEGSAAVASAMRRLDSDTSDLVGNRIKSQADFECWAMKRGQGTEYATFLEGLQQCFDSEGNEKRDSENAEYPKLTFVPPSAAAVTTWLYYLRDIRKLAHDTISGTLAGLSSVNGQYAGSSIDRSTLRDLLNSWDAHDTITGRKKQAPAFDMRFDLPKIYRAVFTIKKYTALARVTMWVTILVMISIMGRGSCMSDYSPLIEEVEYPSESGGYDTDGFPKYLYIPWRNWKGRKRAVGEKYFLVVHRNYTDPRFCPVFWMLKMFTMRKECGQPLTGKLFPYADSKSLRSKLKKIFIHAGMKEFSSHSFRRTAAQWAAQCGADWRTIVDVGRWSDFNEARKYIGQGRSDHKRLIAENDGKDPIGHVWFFRTFVKGSDGCEYIRI